MTDYEQAVKDVAAAFGVNERVISARLKVAANCECFIDVHTKYAVAQREARLRLEDLAREAIKAAGCDDRCTGLDNCHLYDLRAALEAGKEK